jgi:alginate O-acetyltransferase complex protein AlgI
MLFNSFEFILFFTIFIFLFYVIKSLKYKQVLLLISSYFFYGFTDLYNLLYIFLLTGFTYLSGFILERYKSKFIMFFVITIVLLPLLIFKYGNFLSSTINSQDLFYSIYIPLGISFLTFSCISYLIDIFRKEIKHEHNILIFSLFVSYFPKVISGPIERASSLIPQFSLLKRPVKPIIESIKLIIYGLFCKVVLADKLNAISSPILQNIPEQSGGNILIAAFVFSLQIFFDFYSYCLLALAISELLGIKITNNFNFPYFSTSFKEFWQKWNLTLGKWFKDYLYIPLGGNKVTLFQLGLNLLIVFSISGLWHGASINFIIWGAYCGLLLIIELLLVQFKILSYNYKPYKAFFIMPFIFLGWLIFSINDFEHLKIAFKSLFYFHAQYFNYQSLNISSYSFFLFLSAITLFFDRFLLNKILILKPTRYLLIVYELIYFNITLILIFIFWDLNTSSYLYFKF